MKKRSATELTASAPSATSRKSSSRSGGLSLTRISQWGTLLCILLLPGLLWGVTHIRSVNAAVSQWLPSSSPATMRYARFLKWFDEDLFLELAWENCRVDDPRLAQLAEALRTLATENPQLSIRRVITSSDLVDKLTTGPAELSRDAALRRLRGVFVGADESAVMLIELSSAHHVESAELIAAVLKTAQQELGLSRADLKLGGGLYEAVVVDEASSRSLVRYAGPSCLAALCVAWLWFRQLRLTLVILLIAGYCQLFGVAVVYYCGEQLNAVLIVMPTLVFMLTVSASVHLINYYRDAGGAANADAALQAIRVGFIPCILATATTAVGLLSLSVSQLKPVRDFGNYAAIAVLISTTVLLLTFPTLMRLVSQASSSSTAHPHLFRRITHLADRGMRFILARSNTVALVSVFGVVAVGMGMLLLQSTVRIQNMFEPHSEILRNYAWLEENVGPLISVEIVLNFNLECELDDLRRAELLAQIHNAVSRIPEVGGTFSALTFMPTLPGSGGIRNTALRAIYRKKLEQQKAQLARQGVLAVDSTGEHWRVTARVPVIHSLDYGQMTEKIVSACQPIQEQVAALAGVSISFTGLNPVFHEAQQLLFSDLAKSFAMAFLLITPIMMLVLRSMLGGLLAMLPNLAPVAIVFGCMGWLGIPLDIASILTASVALGIAVDDTLHFTTWFTRGRGQGMSAVTAIEFAYAKCAGAMLQTTCICCAAMLAFFAAEFIPTRKFAILMAMMLTAALVGDLVLLPALLGSRLGRWIYRPRRGSSPQ